VRASNLTPKNTVRKRTGEALAGAPAQTAKVPTPFSFREKKLRTGYRTMKHFQEHHFSGEHHQLLNHGDFALLLLSITSFIYLRKRAPISVNHPTQLFVLVPSQKRKRKEKLFVIVIHQQLYPSCEMRVTH
jgi:hypothetical protein